MNFKQGIIICLLCWASTAFADNIFDEVRDRHIPIEITLPDNDDKCTLKGKCRVAFLSAGYGISHLKYTFLADMLSKLDYLVIAVGHELPTDPPLSVTGNLYDTRSENWQRGAETLAFLKGKLSRRFSHYDFENITLIGHSNGGDISAWLANNNVFYIAQLITLDHRRVPLPRTHNIRVLSIRASDFPADKGVLPNEAEQAKFGSCIVKIPNAKHNDIADFGPTWLKESIQQLIRVHLQGQHCSTLKPL